MENDQKNILLLTKNYPPQIGGIEKYAFDLHNRLVSEGKNVKLIAAGPRNEWLLTKKGSRNKLLKLVFKCLYIASELLRLGWFAVRSFTEGAIWVLRQKEPVLIWSMDGSIAWLGVFVKKIATLFQKNSEIFTRNTCLGKDVSWFFPLYQKILQYGLHRTDSIYAFSETIRGKLLFFEVDSQKITIDPYTDQKMIDLPKPGAFNKPEFLKKYNIPPDKILLFSIGRFVEKKGFHWFISEVLPSLDKKFHYVLVGSGPLETAIKSQIEEKELANITLTGPIMDPIEKAKIYSSMDYFIMPNIPTEGDCEGFGLVLLEAKYYGLKCIVSDTDGIGERVWDDDIVLPHGASEKWIKKINEIQHTT